MVPWLSGARMLKMEGTESTKSWRRGCLPSDPFKAQYGSHCGRRGVSKWQEVEVLRELTGKTTEGLKHDLESSAFYPNLEERPIEGFEQRSGWYLLSLQAKITLATMLIGCGKPRWEQEASSWEVKAVMQVRGAGAQARLVAEAKVVRGGCIPGTFCR